MRKFDYSFLENQLPAKFLNLTAIIYDINGKESVRLRDNPNLFDKLKEKVNNAIEHLAKIESKFYYENDDIYIPADIIKLLSDRYNTNTIPIDILYDIYLENYLINIGKKTEQ